MSPLHVRERLICECLRVIVSNSVHVTTRANGGCTSCARKWRCYDTIWGSPHSIQAFLVAHPCGAGGIASGDRGAFHQAGPDQPKHGRRGSRVF